jgi:transposase
MKFTSEEKLDIGRRVCNHELTMSAASKEYSRSLASINNYARLYRIKNGITPIQNEREVMDVSKYKDMSKEELIDQILKAEIEVARAKKGYEVRGDGSKKVYVSLSKKNTK